MTNATAPVDLGTMAHQPDAFVTVPRDAVDQFKIEPGTLTFVPAEGETLGQCIDRCVPHATGCARAVLRGTLEVVPHEPA